jgi:hypothetical protein
MSSPLATYPKVRYFLQCDYDVDSTASVAIACHFGIRDVPRPVLRNWNEESNERSHPLQQTSSVLHHLDYCQEDPGLVRNYQSGGTPFQCGGFEFAESELWWSELRGGRGPWHARRWMQLVCVDRPPVFRVAVSNLPMAVSNQHQRSIPRPFWQLPIPWPVCSKNSCNSRVNCQEGALARRRNLDPAWR